MAKRLSYDQIAERNLLDPLKKEFKEVNQLFEKMAGSLKGIITDSAELAKKTPLEGYEDIEKVEKAIRDTQKAVEGLDKIEKDRLRLQQRLKDLNDDRIKANFELKREIQDRTKALKDEAIINSSTTSEYAKQSAILRKLRNEYKELALKFGENSKEAKALAKEAQELDARLKRIDKTVGQSQRNVGNYEGAVNKLRGTLRKLAASTGVILLLDKLRDVISTNTTLSDTFSKGLGRITITLTVFVERTLRAFQAFGTIFEQIQIRFDRFFLNIEKRFANLPALLGGNAEKAEQLQRKIDKLNERSQALSGQGLSDLLSAYSGIGEEITDLVQKNDRLIDATTRFRVRANQLNRELADLLKTQAQLESASENNTLAISKQQEASENLLETNNKIAEKNLEIAENELSLARQRARVRSGDLAAQEEYAAAYVRFKEVEAEAERTRLDVLKNARELERDALEQDLDIQFDVSDRRKTIAEQTANDERESLETRRAALQQALQDIETTYQQIGQSISDFTGEVIDIDELLSIEDTVELNRRINQIDIDEVTRNRLREALIERLAAVKDLQLAQADLNDSTAEYGRISVDVQTQEELLADIQAGRVQGTQVLEKLEEARARNNIIRLQEEIEAAEENSVVQIRLRQELNDALLQQAADRIAREEELANQAIENQKKNADRAREVFRVLGDTINDAYGRQIDRLDELVDKSKEREDQLREAAQRGVQDAEENLALQQQRTEEAERARQATLQRQKQAELALTAIQIYAGKVQAGEKNALSSTISDVALLRAFVEALPPFYEGAERVGDVLQATIPGKDGHVIRVDGAERILSPSQNALIPRDMTNIELATLAAGSRKGFLPTKGIEQRLDKVANVIQNLELYKGMDWDKSKEAVIYHIEKRGRREKIHHRRGGVFGS